MELTQAYRILSQAASSGRVRGWPVALRLSPDGPEQMTALAHLAGLDECDSLDEVTEAALQGEWLRDIGTAWRARYWQALEDVSAALDAELCDSA